MTQRRKALVVGIDDYHQAPLQGCVNDARRIAALLESANCGFDTLAVLDGEATRSTLREYIHWLLTETDTSVFYFAGHGLRTQVGTYLVTHDTQRFDEGIDLQWLATAANNIAAKEQTVVFILDCCHSGDATARSSDAHEQLLSIRDMPQIQGQGRVLLAACAGTQKAAEYPEGDEIQGAFTRHLCSALSGSASDSSGVVTVNAIYDYISSMLKKEPNQTPVIKGDQHGSIVLATNVQKRGSWTPASTPKLSLTDARQMADNLLSSSHQAITNESSFESWKQSGFANACRIFLPTLLWFRRRLHLQPELYDDAAFKLSNDSCQHFLAKLCSITQATKLVNGQIGSRIGSGTFGIVWKIEGAQWHEPICFKAFHPHDLHDKEKVTRFRRGYDAMYQLDHPNIVKVRELTELPFGFYMQYIEGANLRTFNPAAVAEPDQIVDILIGVLETLKHAHGRGVIHRDVKPENILIQYDVETQHVEPYLTDFDLAWFSSATQVTQVAGFGSHFYAAPEQMDTPTASVAHLPTVDIYSFGQLCFFSICGRDPQAFNHASNLRALSDSLGQKWQDAEATRLLLDVFDRCTRYKPVDRFQDFREISDRLARVRASLHDIDEIYDTPRFLAQAEFNISGRLRSQSNTPGGTSIRSRSGRTEMTLSIIKDLGDKCGLAIAFRPNDIIREGRSSSEARSLVNQRIDTMLLNFSRDHSTERRGAKHGAFEITVRMERLPKSMAGVLKCREIATRTVDILEQA